MASLIDQLQKICLEAVLPAIGNRISEQVKKEEQPPRPYRKRDPGYALREMDVMSDREFKKLFRMNRSTFNRLLALVDPFIASKRIHERLVLLLELCMYC
jgi:hypothetical protein